MMRGGGGFVFNLIALSLFFNISLACIRHNKIRTENASLIFLDDFDFSEDGNGRIELNISEISLPNPNPNPATLSKIGFFVTPTTHERFSRLFREYDASSRCFLDPSYRSFRIPLKRVYTFDQLQNGTTGVSVLFTDTHFNILDYNDSYVDLSDYQAVDIFYPHRLRLLFQTCVLDGHVSMNVRSAAYDETDGGLGRRYIASSLSPSFFLYIALIMCYICLAATWVHAAINKHRWKLSSIYFVFPLAIALQITGIILELSYTDYIANTGETRETSVLIRAFISGILKGTPIPIMMACLLSSRKLWENKLHRKDILPMAAILVSLVVTTTTRLVIIGTWQCWPFHVFPTFMFRMADSFIPVFILCHPCSSTYHHLLRGGKADGKPAPVLRMIQQITTVGVTYVLCLLFTHLFISTTECAPSDSDFYGYTWKVIFLRELVTLSLYLVIGYTFWPDVPNQNIVFSEQEQNAALRAINVKIADAIHAGAL